MALAEAQVLGTPAVVKNHGCLNERVSNKKTGFVCSSDEEFCINTINLLKDDNLWTRMNKELKKKKNYFTWIEIAKKWQKILN